MEKQVGLTNAEGNTSVGSAQPKEYQLGGRGAWAVLSVLFLLFLINRADLAILSVALQPIKQFFNFTDAQAGMLPAIATFGIALLTIPASIFGDRWARRKVISIMGLTWSIFTFVTAIATNLWQLLVARFMVGAGEAGYATTGQNWASASFKPQMRALVLALFQIGGQLGFIIGLIFGGMLVATWGWQSPFYVFAVPGIILATIAFFMPDFKTLRRQGEGLLSKEFFKEVGGLFKVKTYWLIIISQSFFYFTFFAWQAWTPTLLMRAYEMPVEKAGMMFGIIILAMAVGSLIGGFAADRSQRRNKNGKPYFMITVRVLEAVFMVAALLALNGSFGIFFASMMMMIMFGGMLMPVYVAVTTEVTSLRIRASAIGVNNFIAQVTGATLGPLLVGAISDRLGGGAQGIQFGIAWLFIASMLSLIALLIVPRFYPKDSDVSQEALVRD